MHFYVALKNYKKLKPECAAVAVAVARRCRPRLRLCIDFWESYRVSCFPLFDITEVIYHCDEKIKHLVTTGHSEALLRVVSGANTAPR